MLYAVKKVTLELAPGRIVLPVAGCPQVFWIVLARSAVKTRGQRRTLRSFKNNSAPPLVHATFFKGLNLYVARCVMVETGHYVETVNGLRVTLVISEFSSRNLLSGFPYLWEAIALHCLTHQFEHWRRERFELEKRSVRLCNRNVSF